MSSLSSRDPTPDTRSRIVAAAMDIFGRQGFKATTIAQVEAAAGLSPGAGGLYRHFPSKRALLEEGLRRQAEQGAALLSFIEHPELVAQGDLGERLLAVARAGLRRLEQERDVNRLLLRDLSDFPDLLEAFRQQELQRVYGVLLTWLRAESLARETTSPALDVEALAAVLISAVSHYWVLTDVFGDDPFGLGEDRFLGQLAALATQALTGGDPDLDPEGSARRSGSDPS